MAIIIDGISFDIPVLRPIRRRADFLDKYAERNELGDLLRELIGVYFNYEIRFARSKNTATYQALWNKLTEPVEFHTVTVPNEIDSSSFTFTAYFANVGDEIDFANDGEVEFKNLTVNFIAKSPARS